MKLASRLTTNIVVAGGMIGAALLLKRLVRSRRAAHQTPTDETQFAGYEGFSAMAELDDDLTAIAAHQKIAEQRERLPRH